MAYFYHYELILAGIILLSAMGFGGVRLWLNRKKESQERLELENNEKINEPDESVKS